jgi:branched-chain amino acid transport system permease protein
MKFLTSNVFSTILTIILVYGIIKILMMTGVIGHFHSITVMLICINIMLAVSLNLVTGFTGQFSLGHAGFMAIGAYTCAIITMRMPTYSGFMLGIIASAIFAALVGVLIGIPTLRLKGDYLAIATLGMAEIIRIIIVNMQITNGAAGLFGIPRFVNWEIMCFFMVTTIICINNFLKSSHGRACISIREDEIAAESMGINITKYKIVAFAMGAFFAGIAGALYASFFHVIEPGLFGFLMSVDILVIVVLGGMGSLTGSAFASVILAVANAQLMRIPALRMIIYSVMLVCIMIFRPQGLMGSKEITLDKLFKKIGPRKADARIE